MEKGIVSIDLPKTQRIDYKVIRSAVKSAGYELETVALTFRGRVYKSECRTEKKAVPFVEATATGQVFELDAGFSEGEREVKGQVKGWQTAHPIISSAK